jgi:hypothetical protein
MNNIGYRHQENTLGPINSKWCNPHPAASSVTYLPRSAILSKSTEYRTVADGFRHNADVGCWSTWIRSIFPHCFIVSFSSNTASFFCFVLFCFFSLSLVLLRGAWTFGSRGCYTRWKTWLEAMEHVLSTLPVSLARLCVWGSLLSATPETPKGWNLHQHTYT